MQQKQPKSEESGNKSPKSKASLPNDAEAALRASRRQKKTDHRTSVFLGLPSLLWENAHLKRKIFHFATGFPNYRVQIYSVNENRFHDYARQLVTQEFLRSECEWMIMIDADVDPNFNLLNLTKKGKQIIAATVYCHVKDTIYPSIWVRSDCEECAAVEMWRKEKKLKDPC
jgi:hypothetical protein